MVTVYFRLQCIKQIVIVVGDEYMEYMKNLLTKYRFTKVDLVKGSTTRHRSIIMELKPLKQVRINIDLFITELKPLLL
jgi:2-C-methyl-D-erythritol 4-phosphate cytidylyltransferase